MRARSTVLLVLAAGCGPTAPPTPPAGPAPSASSSAPTPVVISPDDLRVVRCGIDDRPRSVVGDAAAPRTPPAAAASRAPVPPPADTRAGAVAGDVAPPETLPEVRFTRDAPASVPEAPLPPAVRDALASRDPQYDVCTSLAELGDAGRHEHRIELSASGAALRVTAKELPTRLERCLMERSCQLRAASGPASALLAVAVAVTPPPPPPPPPDPPPTAAPLPEVDVLLGASTPPFARTVMTALGRRCAGSAGAAAGTKVVVRVTQTIDRDGTHFLEGVPARPFHEGRRTAVAVLQKRGARAAPMADCLTRMLRNQRGDLSGPWTVTVTVR